MTQTIAKTKERLDKLIVYLNTYATAEVQPAVMKKSVENTSIVLHRLVEKFPELPIPLAYPGLDGDIGLTWEKENHHAEADIDSEGLVEFSYYNRDTGRYWFFKVPLKEFTNSEKVADIFKWIA